MITWPFYNYISFYLPGRATCRSGHLAMHLLVKIKKKTANCECEHLNPHLCAWQQELCCRKARSQKYRCSWCDSYVTTACFYCDSWLTRPTRWRPSIWLVRCGRTTGRSIHRLVTSRWPVEPTICRPRWKHVDSLYLATPSSKGSHQPVLNNSNQSPRKPSRRAALWRQTLLYTVFIFISLRALLSHIPFTYWNISRHSYERL